MNATSTTVIRRAVRVCGASLAIFCAVTWAVGLTEAAVIDQMVSKVHTVESGIVTPEPVDISRPVSGRAPEPTTVSLLGLGLLGLARSWKRTSEVLNADFSDSKQ